jgi:hypothetical protein
VFSGSQIEHHKALAMIDIQHPEQRHRQTISVDGTADFVTPFEAEATLPVIQPNIYVRDEI